PPPNSTRFSVEGVHPSEDSNGVDVVAEDERSSVWSGSVFHDHPGLEDSLVRVLPFCSAIGWIDGNDDFLAPAPVHAVEQGTVAHDAGVTVAQAALPHLLGRTVGKGSWKPFPVHDKITIGSAPRGPIGRRGARGAGQQQN